MQDKKLIKHFFFGFAEYHVSDGTRDEVLLRVNYKENSFVIESLGSAENEHFRRELSSFAQDLLKRKHNTDFAKR